MTTTITRRWTVQCPDWCRQEPQTHEPYIDTEGQLIVNHTGPKLGAFATTGEQVDDELTMWAAGTLENPDDLTVADLRAIAANAEAAADWMEAQL